MNLFPSLSIMSNERFTAAYMTRIQLAVLELVADNQLALGMTVLQTIPGNLSRLVHLDFLDFPLLYSFLGKPIKDSLSLISWFHCSCY